MNLTNHLPPPLILTLTTPFESALTPSDAITRLFDSFGGAVQIIFAPLRVALWMFSLLTKLDPQPAAPPPAVTEMRSFKRVAEVVGEKFIGDIQNIQLGRANDFFSFEQIDAGGKVEVRARFDAPAFEIHEFGPRRGFQLFQPILFDF